jgi:hypothetical protein
MDIEIVDVPIQNGGSFHRHVNVYQRANVHFIQVWISNDFQAGCLDVNGSFLPTPVDGSFPGFESSP